MDYVDLVLIHYPCADLKDFPNKCGAAQHAERLDTWRGLQELRSAGKIRATLSAVKSAETGRDWIKVKGHLSHLVGRAVIWATT
eukprot:g13927.t1